MSTAHNPIKLYETVVDECPYLPDQQSASILVDPNHKVDQALFGLLSRSGFRRSGDMLYSPKCPACNAHGKVEPRRRKPNVSEGRIKAPVVETTQRVPFTRARPWSESERARP